MATSSRPVRTTRTTPRAKARPAAASKDVEQVEDFDDEVDAAEAQEAEAGHYVTAMLVDEEIRVVPPGAWRLSWQRNLAQGMFDQFAKHVVHPDDLDLYFEIDPTNDEFEAFVTEAGKVSGESQGKSHGPSRSSRRTRRR